MNIRKLLLAAAAVLLLSPTASAQKKGNVLDISKSITDNSIIFPESFETDTQALLEGWYMKNYAATDDRYRTQQDANTTDAQIIQRLSNLPSAIEMPFNQVVRKYIDRYTKSGRSLVTVCLGLGNYYMPIIEQALEEEGLPLELKYLPMIESAYNPNAVSRAGATGLWQFMLSAAKGYDMEVNSLVDERRDPIESSRKGAKLLKDLYNTYGKWDLAIAAYNCGPGNVNKAIRRAGGDPKQHDFWSIYNYLPSETRGYFPMFVAANYIMNYYPDHNISPVVPKKPLVTDTVSVNYRVNLNQIAKVLDMPLDELRLLNPQFRKDIIPGSAQKSYMLILPSRQVASYIMSENDIRNYNASQYAQRTTAEPGKLQQEDDVIVDEVIDETISPEDELVAQEPPSEDSDADYRMVRQQSERKEKERAGSKARQNEGTSIADKVKAVAAGETVTHKVAAGETLASIADTYHVSASQLKLWNGLRRDAVRTGQELLVKGTATAASEPRQETAAKGHSRARAAAAAQHEEAAPAKAAKPAKPTKGNKSETTQKTAKPAKPATQQADADNGKSGAAKARTRRAQAAAADNAKADSNNTPKAGRKSRNAKADQQAASSKDTKNSRKSRNKKQQDVEEETSKSSKSSKASKKSRSQKDDDSKATGKKSRKSKNRKKEVEKPSNYEVQKGDSYERIAKKTGYTVDEIRKANGGKKGDMIHPGDKVNLPKKGKASKSSKGEKASKSKKSSKAEKSSKSSKGDKSSKSSKSKKKR